MPIIRVIAPVVDIVVVGRPLNEVLPVGVVIVVRDIMVDGSELAARSVIGVIIMVVGIMVFMPIVRCMPIMGVTLFMAMGCCMPIMGIIILGAPPGGLAAALARSPKSAHIASNARAGAHNDRNICLSPSKWGQNYTGPGR
jgi:hypothetical protein